MSVPAGQQNEWVLPVRMAPPSWASFLFRPPQSMKQGSLCYTGCSHWSSASMGQRCICMCQCQSSNSSPPLLSYSWSFPLLSPAEGMSIFPVPLTSSVVFTLSFQYAGLLKFQSHSLLSQPSLVPWSSPFSSFCYGIWDSTCCIHCSLILTYLILYSLLSVPADHSFEGYFWFSMLLKSNGLTTCWLLLRTEKTCIF